MSDIDDKFENFTEEDNYISDTEPTMGFFQRVIGIIVKPSETMDDINKKTNVLPVILMVIMISLLSVVAMIGPMREMLMSQFQLAGLGYEQSQTSMKFALIIGVVTAGVMAVVAPLMKAGVSHMISAIFDCDGTFGKTFAVVMYSYIIVMLGAIIKLPIVLLTNNATFDFNAAIFLPASEIGTTTYTALSLINVFVIWYLGVTIIGLKKVHKYSTGKAAAAALIPWLISAGISIGMVILSSRFS